MSVHLGISLLPDHTSWDGMREFARLVDELGYESLWTWDHFVPLRGDTNGPNFESWQILTAWGALTTRVRIGTLVTGVTYRHPAVLAKMVATLDHITEGRAILGLGAAWHEREHNMYGIPFDSAGVRLAKLDEACRLIRSLLDQPRTDFDGRYYRLQGAVAEPKPVQRRLPLMIGGGGERKTLRITAKYADMWHGFGPPDQIAHKLEVLRAHCAEVSRDPADILVITGIHPGVVIRDDPKEVDAWRRRVATQSRTGELPPLQPLRTVEEVARRMAEYWRVGVRGFILGQGAPYDRETIERLIGEVRPRLLELVA